jgi:putative ABC transport system permease protein
MIGSFVKTAFRQLVKHTTYAGLNLLGLSVGLACFTIIGLWIEGELSYDKFNDKHDRIFRVAGIFTDESGKFDQAVTCFPLAPALVNDLPEVEQAITIDLNDAVVKFQDKEFVEQEILGVSERFFDVFSFPLLKGNPSTVLKDPYSIVLSESMAKKYFGESDPVGASLRMFLYDPDGTGADYKITGVAKDAPANSHFRYNFLFSASTIATARPNPLSADAWFDNGYYTYVLLKPGSSKDQLENKLPLLIDKYMGKSMKQYNIRYDYFLQAVTEIHLKSHLRYEIKPTGNFSYIIIFGAIGFIVLALACINYMNLSTAYASDRFKEVGIRKLLGAVRKQLIGQYMTESWLLAIVSMLVAIGWIEISRPFFENITGQPLTGLYSTQTMLTLFLIASATGLLSGSYPALILSSFKTVNILKGHFKTDTAGAWLRKSLVVVQFSITVALITGILVVQRQLHFIQDRDLGFNKDNLLMFNGNGSNEVPEHFDAFAEELKTNPFVAGVARSNSMLANGLGNSVAIVEDASGKKVNATVYRLRVDHDYLNTYQMNLVAGRNFQIGSAADSTRGFIVNEALTKMHGYLDPQQAVGKSFQFQGRDGYIIGVVKDFHYNSLQQKIEPLCMFLLKGNFSRISVRVTGDIAKAKEKVSEIFKKHFPDTVVDAYFADASIEKQYQAEKRFSTIFIIFSVLSLGIACMGLFSLVSYSVETRTKEIGIRKVLGASIASILRLINLEFLMLIVIAGLIAIPFSYYFMTSWLQDFAYHIDLTGETFLYAIAVTIFISMLTVSVKSIRAALANPVTALRND